MFSKKPLLWTIVILLVLDSWAGPSPALYPIIAQGVSAANVTIVDYAFRPVRLNITTGTIVTWTYVSNGIDIHTVTAKNKTQDGSPIFASTNPNPLHPGESYTYTFDQPGNYGYYCAVHPRIMNAWVNATGSPVNPPPSNPPPMSQAPGGIPLTLTLAVAATGVGVAVLGTLAYRKRSKKLD